jgi:hypothetical protein
MEFKVCCGTVRAAKPKPDVVFKEFLFSLELLGTFVSRQKYHQGKVVACVVSDME